MVSGCGSELRQLIVMAVGPASNVVFGRLFRSRRQPLFLIAADRFRTAVELMWLLILARLTALFFRPRFLVELVQRLFRSA
ncbi:hypothetical protein FWK35_00003645, partial [Aphis craccivora]